MYRRGRGGGCLRSVIFIALLLMLYSYVSGGWGVAGSGSYYEPGAYDSEVYDYGGEPGADYGGYGTYDFTGSSGDGSYSSYTSGRDTAATDINNSLFSAEAVREHRVEPRGDGTDTVSIFIYMNGSTLETDAGEASTDLSEMIGAGSSDRVNIIVETLGTRRWQRYGIASDRSQIYKVDGGGLTLLRDDLGQLDCTVSETLSDFISWGAANYPADRYMLILWDHGGGPVYGFGEDQYQGDYESLTIDEMQTALHTAGVYFDLIGMDCCIMSCMETCCALYDYADYAMLSEDFESGLGWYYKDWIKALTDNSSTPTEELGKLCIDGTVKANERDSRSGADSILALIDLSYMKVLYTAWTNFAYANESALTEKNYSRRVTKSGRESRLLGLKTGGYTEEPAASSGYTEDNDNAASSGARAGGSPSMWDDMFSYWSMGDSVVSMSDYYITDIMAVAQNIASDESDALSSALASTLVYVNSSEGDSGLTGLSVTLPYGDRSFYSDLKTIFANVGFDSDYISWLGNFVSASGYSDFYDYGNWENSWSGWSDYDDTYNWSLWDLLYGAASYWNDSAGMGWSDWDYNDSYNQWYDDNNMGYGGPGYGGGYWGW